MHRRLFLEPPLNAALLLAALTFTKESLALKERAPHTKRGVEAAQASAEGRIVILYGPGIRDANSVARSLVKRGYPATVMDGGKPDEIKTYMDGEYVFGTYTQHDLNSGTVGAEAMRNYNRLLGKP